MKDLAWHKGDKCIVKSELCQEGYCSGCFVMLELKDKLTEEEKSVLGNIPKDREFVVFNR